MTVACTTHNRDEKRAYRIVFDSLKAGESLQMQAWMESDTEIRVVMVLSAIK